MLVDDRGLQARVVAIAQAARIAGVHVVAKHVDCEQSQSLLQALGVDFVQGYCSSAPTSLEAVAAQLDERRIVDPLFGEESAEFAASHCRDRLIAGVAATSAPKPSRLKDAPSANGARKHARAGGRRLARAAPESRVAPSPRASDSSTGTPRTGSRPPSLCCCCRWPTRCSTLVLVQHGAIEINPLMEPFVVGNGPAFAFLKLALTATAVMILVVLTRVPTFGRLLAGPISGGCGCCCTPYCSATRLWLLDSLVS